MLVISEDTNSIADDHPCRQQKRFTTTYNMHAYEFWEYSMDKNHLYIRSFSLQAIANNLKANYFIVDFIADLISLLCVKWRKYIMENKTKKCEVAESVQSLIKYKMDKSLCARKTSHYSTSPSLWQVYFQ